MTTSLQPHLSKLAIGKTLNVEESKEAFEIMMSGSATPSQIGALLMGMRVRGETINEIVGAVTAMRYKAVTVEVLGKLGSSKVWVVHGEDGMDELTTTGKTFVAALENGSISSFEVSPEDIGLRRCQTNDLVGGSPQFNSEKTKNLLRGEHSPYRDIVIMNTAAALIVGGIANDLKHGANLAVDSIDSGKAHIVLEEVIKITNRAETAGD